MCEHFGQIEKKTALEKTKNVVSKAEIQNEHTHIQEKIRLIHNQEHEQQIIDFLEANPNITKKHDLKSTTIIKAISNYTSELKELDPNYNIWDDESFDLDSIIEVYLQNNKITHQIESIKKAKQVALSIEDFVLKEKETGKSNLQIIQAIIDQYKQGVLPIPRRKVDQYQSILALSSQAANTTDQNYIEEIINGTQTNLLDEGSFENIIFQIYEDGRISAETKVIIEQQFQIKPIHTGGDLKQALENRNKLIKKYNNQLDQLNHELLLLDKEERSLEQELNSFKIKLASTTAPQEREELYQEINTIEQELRLLQAKKEQTFINSNNLKQQKPTNKVALRGHHAKLEKGLISIKNPINGSSVRIPIQADNEKTGMIANSLFLRRILQPTEAEKLIFPGERFTPNDLPTFTMLPFSNEILATLHLGHSGNILTLFELKTLQKQFKRLQNPNNPTYLKSPADGIKEDFKALGLLDNSMLIKHKFLSLLNDLHSQPNLKLF